MKQNKNLLDLASDLIKRKSITPEDDGAINVLKKKLKSIGFINKELPFGNAKKKDLVKNLYSVRHAFDNNKLKTLCFAGHTDVVPVGNIKDWKHPPFDGKIVGNKLFGRGASDMKGAIAAWISACETVISHHKLNINLALLITGDEEGIAKNGTKKLVSWMKKNKIKIDHCIVGEPTNPSYMGEMIKVGRRGSLTLEIQIKGKAGHVAYPHLAINPVSILLDVCYKINKINLNKKSENFPISNLEITSVDVGNKASNVIPANCKANLNIRYNPAYDEFLLLKKINNICKKSKAAYKIKIISSNMPFYTKPDHFIKLLKLAIKKNTSKNAKLSTTGGTSDARFIKDICPVIEFGAIGKTMHQTNENMQVKDLMILESIYKDFIISYNNFYSSHL